MLEVYNGEQNRGLSSLGVNSIVRETDTEQIHESVIRNCGECYKEKEQGTKFTLGVREGALRKN